MRIKQHLKMGMVALSLFLFNIQFSHAETCGPDKSFGSIECHCCMVGPSGPTPEGLLYTNLRSGDNNSDTNACNRCGVELAADGVCTPNVCSQKKCYGQCNDENQQVSPK